VASPGLSKVTVVWQSRHGISRDDYASCEPKAKPWTAIKPPPTPSRPSRAPKQRHTLSGERAILADKVHDFPDSCGRPTGRTALVRLGLRRDDEFGVAGPVPKETGGRILE
jgi:hypothetical protein